eukprot:gb/GFBE01054979.1/.p1 GENE.gb/GFBE01054979.1/~~gb/GFBE01054979.1/.p1  ORF type:complete len:653 (+),score=98.07 gb/GFBE01054979.1/:1-1959(+)
MGSGASSGSTKERPGWHSASSSRSLGANEDGTESSALRMLSAGARPFRNWLAWVRGSEEITTFRPTVDFLHVVSSPNTSLELYVRTIIDEVMRLLDADRCSIFFVNEVRCEVWCVGALDMEPFSMPWDKGIVGMVATQGKMVNLQDAHAHSSFDSTVEKRTGYTCNTLLAIPVKNTLNLDRTIGVIQVLNKRGSATACFAEQDAIELQKIAMVIGDSFYRQRWNALANLLADKDNEVQAVLDQHRDRHATPIANTPKMPKSPEIVASFSGLSLRAPTPVSAEVLASLEFSALSHSEELLKSLVPVILRYAGCIDNCQIPLDCLKEFVAEARQGYQDNPFHNWFHGFSVYQHCFHQLSCAPIFGGLSSTQGFGLLIAALCHDLGHPGVTNSFLIRTSGELALRYNDVSVLENHHASLTCQLLRKENTAIGSGLDSGEQVVLRKTIIKCILATDMSHHSELCQKLIGCASPHEFGANSLEDPQFLMNLCVHSADLSAQVLPWKVASQWEARISDEFMAQATKETELGFTPEPFMQFKKEDLAQRGKLQRDFVDFVLLPLWEPYAQLVPPLAPCHQNLMKNRALYDLRRIHGHDGVELPSDKLEQLLEEVSATGPAASSSGGSAGAGGSNVLSLLPEEDANDLAALLNVDRDDAR